jgi:hypothetical protein
VPQAPQLLASLARSRQPFGQLVSDASLHTQVPALHAWPILQAVPHAPQLSELVIVSTHELPHAMRPGGHTQAPAWHVSAARHASSQMPQWFRSIWMSTHAEPQRINGTGHGSVSAMQLVPPQI